jgi:hypothetical protein
MNERTANRQRLYEGCYDHDPRPQEDRPSPSKTIIHIWYQRQREHCSEIIRRRYDTEKGAFGVAKVYYR